MIKEYKFNRKDKQKYFYKVLFQLFIWLVIPVAGIIIYKEIEDSYTIRNIIITVLAVWGMLYLLPLLILYFNHRANSKSVVFLYNKEGNIFIYDSNKRNITFTMDEIEKVELYLRPNAYENFIELQYFGNYHYYKFFIHNSEPINLSCLVCDEIEDILPKKLIEKKKKYLPIIE